MRVVALSVLGGLVIEVGPLDILIQPAELVIIGGAALGTLVIGTPKPHLIRLARGLKGLLISTGGTTRDTYLEILRLQYEIFVNARKNGFIALDQDISEPEKSPIFSKYPDLLARHEAMTFTTDSLRLLVDGAVSPYDLDHLLDREMETHFEEASKSALILAKVDDTQPGLGIVAAVLGIVISMPAIDGPADQMGHKAAVALVGTFMASSSPMASSTRWPSAWRLRRSVT